MIVLRYYIITQVIQSKVNHHECLGNRDFLATRRTPHQASLVEQKGSSPVDKEKNRALYDKNMNLGTSIQLTIGTNLKIGSIHGILGSPCVSRGSYIFQDGRHQASQTYKIAPNIMFLTLRCCQPPRIYPKDF